MAAPKASINGKTILGPGDAAWTLTAGGSPNQAVFAVAPGDANELVTGSLRPVELKINAATFRGVYILERVPGDNAFIAKVRVADRRWFWERQHISRAYNMRRHMGVKRLTAPQGVPVTFPVVQDVQYEPWSLRNQKTRWTARQILSSIFEELKKAEREATGQSFNFRIEGEFDVPVENLELEDNGSAAVTRMLGYVPGAAVTVDPDGSVRVFARTTGREEAATSDDTAGPEHVGQGHIELISHEMIRPRRVDILLTRELEVRFDAEEIPTGRTSPGPASDGRFMDNVMPLPDFNTSIGGVTLVQGTYRTINSALFNSWGGAPGFGVITTTKIRRALVPYMDLWAGLRLSGARNPDVDWAARIAAIQQHFRRTYRINRRWIDRIRQLNANRVALFDPATGTRAPALAYSNYCIVSSQRTMFTQVGAGQQASYFINVDAFNGGTIGGSDKGAPADVRIVDQDQGIIRIEWKVDENRTYEMVLPSKLANGPTADPTSRQAPIGFDLIARGMSDLPELESGHQLAVIMSAIPGSPNTDQRLHRIRRFPQQAAKFIPSGLRGGLNNARGPVLEVRVGKGLETARYAWADNRSGEIERAFGLRPGKPEIDALLINGGPGGTLDALADAIAARVYVGFADRIKGTKTAQLRAEAKLEGQIESITHTVFTDGVVSTRYGLTERPLDIDATAFLPASVRAILFKLGSPGKQG